MMIETETEKSQIKQYCNSTLILNSNIRSIRILGQILFQMTQISISANQQLVKRISHQITNQHLVQNGKTKLVPSVKDDYKRSRRIKENSKLWFSHEWTHFVKRIRRNSLDESRSRRYVEQFTKYQQQHCLDECQSFLRRSPNSGYRSGIN